MHISNNFLEGRSLAISHDCKYVEVSSALDHNVDTLLVGIVKQIRLKNLIEKQRTNIYARSVPMFNILNVVTVLTFNILNVGTVPMFKEPLKI